MGWTPQSTASVWRGCYNDGVTEITAGFPEVAAVAGAVAGQVGVVTGLCCGNVQSVPRAACHELPLNQDGGVMALSKGGDTREGAGGWKTGHILVTLSSSRNTVHTVAFESIYVSFIFVCFATLQSNATQMRFRRVLCDRQLQGCAWCRTRRKKNQLLLEFFKK